MLVILPPGAESLPAGADFRMARRSFYGTVWWQEADF
jgi:hypothetical protein